MVNPLTNNVSDMINAAKEDNNKEQIDDEAIADNEDISASAAKTKTKVGTYITILNLLNIISTKVTSFM